MKRLLPLLLALFSLGSVLPAAADEAGFRDGDEQPFCESPGPCPDSDYMDLRWLTRDTGNEGAGVETRSPEPEGRFLG